MGLFDKVAVIIMGIVLLSLFIIFERFYDSSRGPAQLGRRFARTLGAAGLALFLAQGLTFMGTGTSHLDAGGWALFISPAVVATALWVLSCFFGNPGAPWIPDQEDDPS